MSTITPASSRPRGRRKSHRRGAALVAVVALLVGVAAACEPAPPDTEPPRWAIGGKPVETALGPHVGLSWPAATGNPTRYRIDANGVTATMLTPGTATSCVMVGLAANTAYTFKITAYDAAGNWSGSLPNTMEPPGYRAANYTTPAGPGGGPTLRCVPVTDTDADRLPDTLETGDRYYDHAADTGSLAGDRDTDDDGLTDGDEVLGSPAGLDLRALGARPEIRDVLVEIDWLTGYTPHPQSGCSSPTNLAPSAASLALAVEAYDELPSNDGWQLPGVNLIIDVGQGGAFDGGGPLADDDGRPNGGILGSRDADMAVERRGYFRHVVNAVEIYALFAGYVTGGLARKGGDYVGIGQGCSRFSDFDYASTLVHEIGHNLDLDHGGHESVRDKPNYSSVMNYRYAYDGVDDDCDAEGDGRIGFSEEVLPPLDENAVDERVGVCGDHPADLDRDGVIDMVPYAADLNGTGGRTVLQGSNDLENMDLAAFVDPNRAGGGPDIYDPPPTP